MFHQPVRGGYPTSVVTADGQARAGVGAAPLSTFNGQLAHQPPRPFSTSSHGVSHTVSSSSLGGGSPYSGGGGGGHPVPPYSSGGHSAPPYSTVPGHFFPPNFPAGGLTTTTTTPATNGQYGSRGAGGGGGGGHNSSSSGDQRRVSFNSESCTQARKSDNTASVGNCSRTPDALFQEEILILIRNKDKSERKQILNVLLREKSLPPSHSKELYLQVTDSHDPFFFFSLSLTEDDFQHLKSHQGLLVDFGSFPSMLVQLLEKCHQAGNSESAKFMLILNSSAPNVTLEFTELNFFKHLCHLALIVVKSTDSQLKEYLVDCIKSLKTEVETSSCSLQAVQQQLEAREAHLAEVAQQLEAVRRQQQETSSSLNQKLVQEVQQEKERCSQALGDMQNRFEREKRECEEKQARVVEQLENRVASLDVQNRDLLEVRYRTESSQRELKSRLTAREEDVGRLEAELAKLRRERGQLELGQGEGTRRIQQMEARLLLMEEEGREKNRELEKSREATRIAGEDKARLEREVAEKTSIVARRETAVRSITEELMKANEIIRKLQDQVKQEQGKVKLRGQIAAEQEKLLGERERECEDVREQLRQLQEGQLDSKQQLRSLEERLTDRETKIEMLEKTVETNENVVNWLNKQLTSYKTAEQKLGGVRGRGRGGGLTGRRGGIESAGIEHKNKENEPVVGLDPKYFEHSTPGGSLKRVQIPDVTSLPSNVRRGGGPLRSVVPPLAPAATPPTTAGLLRKPVGSDGATVTSHIVT